MDARGAGGGGGTLCADDELSLCACDRRGAGGGGGFFFGDSCVAYSLMISLPAPRWLWESVRMECHDLSTPRDEKPASESKPMCPI